MQAQCIVGQAWGAVDNHWTGLVDWTDTKNAYGVVWNPAAFSVAIYCGPGACVEQIIY